MIFKRKIIPQIEKWLDGDYTIVLHGARQVGKTSILKFIQNQLKADSKTCFFVDLEDNRKLEILDSGYESFLNYLKLEVTNFDLEQKIFVFIDEIQYMQNPSSFIKLITDHHKNIQLILSGSSSFDIKSKFSDSLVGRIVEFEVFGLSFEEFLEFKDANIDLKNVRSSSFHLNKVLDFYKEFMYFGSYPQIALESSIEKKEFLLQQIIQTYIQKDVRDLAKIRDITKFNNLLKLLAEQSGQTLNLETLASITGLNRLTVEKYLMILENTYIIKLVTPFSTNRRVEISKAPKIFFYDTGIMQLLWLQKLNTSLIGNVFETSVFGELIKKYGLKNIHYWRTKTGVEIDFVLKQKPSDKLPIEVKYNFKAFKNKNIQKFLQKYNLNSHRVVGMEGVPTENMIYPWEI